MFIYKKYFIINLLKPLFASIFVLCAIIWTTRLNLYLYLITKGGVATFDIVKISFYVLCPVILIVLPIATVLTIILTYNKMIETREIFIFKNCGLTKYQLIKPAINLSIIMTIIAYSLSLFGVNRSYYKIFEIKRKMYNNISLNVLKEGVFTEFQNFSFYVDKKNDNEFENIVIRKKDKKEELFLQAQKATLYFNNVKLYNGTIHKTTIDKKSPDILFFKEYVTNIDNLLEIDSVDFYYKVSNIPTLKLLEVMSGFPKIKSKEKEEKYFLDLKKNKIGIDNKKAIISEINYRFFFPITCFVLTIFSGALMLNNSFNRVSNIKTIIKTTLTAGFLFLIIIYLFKNINDNLYYIYILHFIILSTFIVSFFLIREDRFKI
jgi:lipopolysaccharide export system permease protein